MAGAVAEAGTGVEAEVGMAADLEGSAEVVPAEEVPVETFRYAAATAFAVRGRNVPVIE